MCDSSVCDIVHLAQNKHDRIMCDVSNVDSAFSRHILSCTFLLVCHGLSPLSCVLGYLPCCMSWVLSPVVCHGFYPFSLVSCVLSVFVSYALSRFTWILSRIVCLDSLPCCVSSVLSLVACHGSSPLSSVWVLFLVVCHEFSPLSCVWGLSSLSSFMSSPPLLSVMGSRHFRIHGNRKEK